MKQYSIKYIWGILGILLIAQSCGSLELYDSDKTDVLAQVGKVQLRESQIPQIYTAQMTKTDSINVRNIYIEEWILAQVKTIAAIKMLQNNESALQEIEKLVENYRLRLLHQELERSITGQRLDTVITQQAIKEYYTNNKSHFKLSSPLVRSIVVRLPEGIRQGERLKEMFLTGNDTQLKDFIDICAKNNYLVYDQRNQWEPFTTTMAHIPLQITDMDNFLSKNRNHTLVDQGYTYLMRIEKYLPSGAFSPLEMEQDRIIVILRNLQKRRMVQRLDDSLLNAAYSQGIITKH